MNKEELWQAVLAQIQLSTSRANFATWFHNTKIISEDNGEILISVPNSFSKEWLSNKYHSSILKVIRSLNKNIRNIDYVVNLEKPQRAEKNKHHKKENEPEINQLCLDEFEINQKTNLNPRYTFDNFIIGSFNEAAHAAAWAVSENPGFDYNPLFIYGGVGLGKTHLLEATGNKILENFSKKKIVYTPAERFTSKIVTAIREHKIEELKTELRNIDVLIMDDIQFLAGKEKTQEEFFHIFNALRETNKQIILSSDRPPKAIPALEERLRSRFEGGMIMDISIPDFETRMAILKTKCEEKNIELKADVLEYIVSNIQKNIRELEGALNRIIACHEFNNSQATLESTKNILGNLLVNTKSKSVTSGDIIDLVSNFFNISQKDIIGKSRKKELVYPRQIIMFLMRTENDTSYPTIGHELGGRDHTTAMHAFNKIKREFAENEKTKQDIESIKQLINTKHN